MNLDSIWSMILSLVSESGVWAMLFLALLIILIKSNNEREQKYQNIIDKLGNSLKKVEEIKEDVEDLKSVMGIGHKKSEKIEQISQPNMLEKGEKIEQISQPDMLEAKEENNEPQTKG